MTRLSGIIRVAFIAGVLGMAVPSLAWAGGTGFEGRVIFEGAGLAGVYVEAFAFDAAERPLASVNTGADGSYRIELPRGTYRLTARRRPAAAGAGGMLYGNSGAAGLVVTTGYKSIPDIRLADSGSEGFSGREGASVRGMVSYEGRPASGSCVTFYPGALRRGPGYAVKARCGPDGRFEVRLDPGTYTMAARLSRGAEDIGSVTSGDLVGDYDRNPFEVSGADLNLGVVVLRRVDLARLEERKWGSGTGAVTVSGRVIDESGKPVAGVWAFLYSDHRMVGKPSAISSPTGPDGAFLLAVEGPGMYYLGARSRFGGPVEPGELMGAYGRNSPEPVDLSTGPAAALTIVVREVW